MPERLDHSMYTDTRDLELAIHPDMVLSTRRLQLHRQRLSDVHTGTQHPDDGMGRQSIPDRLNFVRTLCPSVSAGSFSAHNQSLSIPAAGRCFPGSHGKRFELD
jgi:hypothetical protein